MAIVLSIQRFFFLLLLLFEMINLSFVFRFQPKIRYRYSIVDIRWKETNSQIYDFGLNNWGENKSGGFISSGPIDR